MYKQRKLILSVLGGLLVALMLAGCGDPTTLPASAPTVAATTAAPAATAANTTALVNLPTVTPAATTAPAATVPATTASVATTAVSTTAALPATTVATTVAATTAVPATTAATTTAATTTIATTTAAVTSLPASSVKNLLAYVDGGSLMVVNPISGAKDVKLAASPQQVAIGRPDWSPSGQLAVTVQPKTGGASQIVLFNTAAGLAANLEKPANVSDSEPVWSADGTLIAFTRKVGGKSEIWLVDSNGQNQRKLTNGQQPSWAPDNARLAFVTEGTVKAGLAAPQDNALHIINAQGQNEWEPINIAKIPNDLTSLGFPFQPSPFFIQYPTWLDGGKTLAFTTLGHSGLVITINASTGKDLKFWDTQYEGSFGITDSTSAGSWLVYQSFPPSGTVGVRIINTTGKPDLQKFSGLNVGDPRSQIMALHPAISPDGTQVAYMKVVGPEGSSPDLKSITGTLVVAQIKNGKLEEKELFKANIQSLAWSN